MKGKDKKSHSHQKIFIGIGAVIVILLAALFSPKIFGIHGSGVAAQQYGKYNFTNLNISDINQYATGALYAAHEINNITVFNNSLLNPYVAASVSAFNLTQPNPNTTINLQYPASIVSGVILMRNSSSANQSLEYFLFSNNANQTDVSGLNGTNYTAYSYKNYTVKIYEVYSIAANSAIGLTSSKENLPDYQYAAIFAYRNYLCTIITNSRYETLGKGTAVKLAEVLSAKLNDKRYGNS